MSDMNPPPDPGSGQQSWDAPSQQPGQQQPGAYPQGGYAPPGAPMSDFGRPLAEWWKRLVALIIDALVLSIPSMILFSIFFAGMFSAASVDPVTGEISGGSAGLFSAGFIGMALALAILPVIYYSVMNGSDRGQTVGKMAMKIQVRDATTGGPIGVGKGFVRSLLPFVVGAICGIISLIDGLAPLWDAKRQAWHDKMANSVVVDA